MSTGTPLDDTLAPVAAAAVTLTSGRRYDLEAGDERVEAANVQIQANVGEVGVRAMHRIALDDEHIGLNDAPLPYPFN